MQQVTKLSRTLAKAQEAERRAYDDFAGILKELDAEGLYSCPEAPFPWAQIELMLNRTKVDGFNSTKAKQILRTGLIRRVIKYVVDFHSLPNKSNLPTCNGERQNVPGHSNASKDPSQFHFSWMPGIVGLPESPELYDEYHHFGRELIRVYPDVPVFWWDPDDLPEDTDLTGQRFMCLNTLLPSILDPRFWGTPIPNADDFCDVTPLIARLRQSIRVTPTTGDTRRLATASAQTMVDSMHVGFNVNSAPTYNMERTTGLSYSELVRQCLVSVGDDLQNIEHIMAEQNLINVMVAADPSSAFRDVLVSQRIVTWSASIMKVVNSRYDEVPNKSDAPGHPNWHACTLVMITCILGLSFRVGDARPALEAIKAKVLHLGEWCSVTFNFDRNPDNITCIYGPMVLGAASTDQETRAELWNQLHTIIRRMERRPDVSPDLMHVWKEVYSRDTNEGCGYGSVERHAGPVCATIGCDSADPAGMACARCQSVFYCSKLCQRADWKSHKPYCKSAKV